MAIDKSKNEILEEMKVKKSIPDTVTYVAEIFKRAVDF